MWSTAVSAFLTYISTVAYLYSRSDAWQSCFKGILLGLSDQALVTGLSITIAALVFGSNDMSVYHFEIAMDLASLALGVHLLSSLVLSARYIQPFRGGVDSARNQTHQGWVVQLVLIIWRRFCMFATTVLLIFMWSTTSFDTLPNCPTKCSGYEALPSSKWHKLRSRTIPIIVADTFLFVVLGDLPNGEIVPKAWWSWLTWHPYLRLLYRIEFLVSLIMAFGFSCCAATLLAHDYIKGSSYLSGGELRVEHSMGFGQIIPLILLMLPFMAAATAYYGELSVTLEPGWN